MTECRTPELQDLLPDYVSASLDATAASLVEQHLSICEPCRDDIVLLRRVRAVRPQAPPVDVARIVASLPRPTPTLHLVQATPAAAAPPAGASRRRWSTSVWQVAAAVGVLMVGGASMVVSRNSAISIVGVRSPEAQMAEAAERARSHQPDSGTPPAAAVAAGVDSPRTAIGARGTARVSVSYGDLGNYSASELQRMLDRLEQWDGTSSTEPLPTLPVVSIPGGTAP